MDADLGTVCEVFLGNLDENHCCLAKLRKTSSSIESTSTSRLQGDGPSKHESSAIDGAISRADRPSIDFHASPCRGRLCGKFGFAEITIPVATNFAWNTDKTAPLLFSNKKAGWNIGYQSILLQIVPIGTSVLDSYCLYILYYKYYIYSLYY